MTENRMEEPGKDRLHGMAGNDLVSGGPQQ